MKDKKSQTQNVDDDKRCVAETEDVPLYRSYGVTKKVNPTARKIRDFFAKALTVILLVFELALILLTTAMLAFYTDVLIATVLFLILFSIFFFNATKLLRRRLSFLNKLKKTFKKTDIDFSLREDFLNHFLGQRIAQSILRSRRVNGRIM